MRALNSNHRSRRRVHRRRPDLQRLEARHLLTAVPLGATPLDTGEFLLGRVVVTPVLFESNGQVDPQTQNWTVAEVDEALAKVTEGVNWWRDTLDALHTVHSLEFVIDPKFAKNASTGAITPVSTPYEPIDRTSNFFSTYVGEFLTDQGYGNVGSIENAIQLFNNQQRIAHQADWAFTIVMVDSSNDSDGQFADGGDFGSAFAFAGGQFIVTPSTRPASTIAHEMGHIFWARDEYPGGGSYTDRRGYYNAQNLNAADNPNNVQEPSIMRGGTPLQQAYEGNFSPASTLALVGWRDSDGDGVFDVADVPLELDAIGTFDASSSTYRLVGTASAVPLINRNSAGLQSDITLNRVSQIQYSIDQGPWTTAASPNAQVADIDIQITVNPSFQSIRWRAIDQAVGITSNIVEGTHLLPALADAALRGFAFLDSNGNGLRESSEIPLSSTLVMLTTAEGESLPSGSVAASDFGDVEIDGVVNGASIVAAGELVAAEVASFSVSALGDRRVFHSFNRQSSRYTHRWSDRAAFVANFEDLMGQVEVDMIGLGNGSYGRLEAYDAAGNLITRVTSELVGNLQLKTLTVADSQARIASIRFFGHGRTDVALSAIRFEVASQTMTDVNGVWRLPNLPAGDYRVTLQTELLIHQFDTPTFNVQVASSGGSLISSAAKRVNSPRHNASLAVDVNGDGELKSQDALIVINDLSRNEARILGHDESTGMLVDVNHDGSITTLDALIVINALSRQSLGEGESSSQMQKASSNDSAASEADDRMRSLSATSELADEVFADWTDEFTPPGISQPMLNAQPRQNWKGFETRSDESDRRGYDDHETAIEGRDRANADSQKGLFWTDTIESNALSAAYASIQSTIEGELICG